jgi:hypothetical protein
MTDAVSNSTCCIQRFVPNDIQSKNPHDSFDLLLHQLNDFYNKPEMFNRLTAILEPNSPISFRMIDWVINVYSKKNNVNLYSQYESEMKFYSNYTENLFDIFCRGVQCTINSVTPSGMKTQYVTSIGQLNFVRWMLENNVYTYISENFDFIKYDMCNNEPLFAVVSNINTQQ